MSDRVRRAATWATVLTALIVTNDALSIGSAPDPTAPTIPDQPSISANIAPPPEKLLITAGGVDIRSGRMAYSVTDLSIGGEGTGGINFIRTLTTDLGGHINPFANFSHNWDISLMEKRIDIQTGHYQAGTGLDFRLMVNIGGGSDTFQGLSTAPQVQQISDTQFARLSYTGDRSSAGAIYTYTESGGRRYTFRPLGSADCAIGAIRCAYVSQIIDPDGTTLNFEYEPQPGAKANASRLRSVVSNRGYALLLEYSGTGAYWNFVTRACVLNLTLVAKPANNACPSSAVATTNYTYTSVDNTPKLASAVDALGAVAQFSYTTIPFPSDVVTATRYAMSMTKPGASAPWQTATVEFHLNNDGTFDQITTHQIFVDGSLFDYDYFSSPQIDGQIPSLAGGSYADALGSRTFVYYDFPILPPQSLLPGTTISPNIGDTNFQMTPGPVQVIDPLGRTTTMDYCDPNLMKSLPANIHDRCMIFRLHSSTDPEGVQTLYTFSLGQLIKTQRIAKPGSGLPDIVKSFGDNCGGNLTLCGRPSNFIDAKGNVTDYTYDPNHGGLLTETLPAPTAGAVRPQKRYTYTQQYAWYKDSSGALVQAATPVWLLTSISECRSQANCAGTSDETRTTIVYGAPGTPNNLLSTSATVAAGDGSTFATSTNAYDSQGNVISVDGPLPGNDDTTRFRYDVLRRVVGEVTPDPDGGGPLPYRATRNTYDPGGDLIRIEKGTVLGVLETDWSLFNSLQTVDTRFDGVGHKIRESVSAGGVTSKVTQFSYDLAGRLKCAAVRMDPGQWNAQPDACVPQLNGPYGPDRISRNTYNAAGERIKLEVGVGTRDQADEETSTYTSTGNVETITDGESNKTTYAYDGHDRLRTTLYPDKVNKGTSSAADYEQFDYDLSGNTTSRRLRDGQSIAFTYDALNRVTFKDLPSAEVDVSFAYDLQGRAARITQGGNSLAFSFDALGRMLSEVGPQGAMTYLYDSAGRRTRTTWPDGFYVTQDYLITGEVAAIRESGATSGPGVLATYGYNSLGNRTGIGRGNGTTSTFGYDPISRLTSLAHDLAGAALDLRSTFAYNPANQLTRHDVDNDRYVWNGHYNVNRPYAINGLNQLTNAGGSTISYDSRGNLTNNGSSAYSYTVDNRLASGPNNASFAYDPSGRLSQSSGNSGTVRFQYDGTDLVAEYNSANQLQRRYVHGPGADEPLVWYEGGGTADRRWYHQDERGSVIAVSNATGANIAINSYDEYGAPAATNLGRFQYTGQTWMPDTGLYYYKARVYSPSLGRFLQTDPIGYKAGLNWYAYVGDDPTDRDDPTGLRDVDVYIWHGEGTEVGHVMLTEHGSPEKVILSQFPDRRRLHGENGKRSFADTVKSEGRGPDSIWTISIRDDHAFDKAAVRERTLKTWSVSPSEDTTQCSIAASRALEAGGVNLTAITSGTLMPRYLDNNIAKNQSRDGNNIRKVYSSAESKQGYDSVRVNANGTVTGTFTDPGSHIRQSTTCDADGHCTTR